MPLWKITDKGHSKAKEAKFKQENHSIESVFEKAEITLLFQDAFPAQEFDFMLGTLPYGKSWKKDFEAMGGKDGMRDPRFTVMHKGKPNFTGVSLK
jgi:type I restriction enzyme M protein